MVDPARQTRYVPFLNERSHLGSLLDKNGNKIQSVSLVSTDTIAKRSQRLRAKHKEIFFGLKRKSLRASEERQKNMQLFIPNQMNFSVDVSTSMVPPIANTSIEDSLD